MVVNFSAIAVVNYWVDEHKAILAIQQLQLQIAFIDAAFSQLQVQRFEDCIHVEYELLLTEHSAHLN